MSSFKSKSFNSFIILKTKVEHTTQRQHYRRDRDEQVLLYLSDSLDLRSARRKEERGDSVTHFSRGGVGLQTNRSPPSTTVNLSSGSASLEIFFARRWLAWPLVRFVIDPKIETAR